MSSDFSENVRKASNINSIPKNRTRYCMIIFSCAHFSQYIKIKTSTQIRPANIRTAATIDAFIRIIFSSDVRDRVG